MAQVNIEEVVDHLRSEMRRALEEALKETVPDAKVDSYEFFSSVQASRQTQVQHMGNGS